MDLFVDAIDSKLQSSEKYLKLLRSRKKRKRRHANHTIEKNKSESNDDPAKGAKGQGQKPSGQSPTQAAGTEVKGEAREEENPTPFLNFLIDTCTELVRASNQVAGANYRNLLESQASSQKVSSIKRKCQKSIDEIKAVVKKMATDHVFDENTNLLDVLCDEIEYGLKKHNKNRFPREVVEFEESPKTVRSPLSLMSTSDTSNEDINSTCDVKVMNFKSKKMLKRDLMKFEKACLTTYSIHIDVANYDLGSRPQDQWRDSIDNFSNRSYNPAMLLKCNQIEPQIRFAREFKDFRYFEKGFVPKIYPKFEFLSFVDRDHKIRSHPYSQEINSLVWSEERTTNTHQGYKLLGGEGSLFKITENVSPGEPKYKMVVTETEFDEMIEKIQKYPLLSIDLEHHDNDTYRGFTCLLQLSTVDDDYIVDPFNMFGHIKNLNKVTTDPKILKVMHGASNDVIWLQRDFGVFVVNLFDTREAAKILNLSEQSLSKLLEKYFRIKLNKIHQLSDWSKRPLNEDMLNYACSDSHYLLPLYVTLKNEILSKNDGRVKILQVMNSSRGLCLKQYNDKGIELYQKFKNICRRNKMQISQLDFVSYNFMLNLISFRNYVARKLDKSEQLIIRDYQISIIVKRLRTVTYHQLLTCLCEYLHVVKYEISNLIRIKNTIELIQKKFNAPELILIRPRSIQFILNCLNDNNVDQLKADEIEKLKHTTCIDNTLKVYNKFVADGLFNSLSPVQLAIDSKTRGEEEDEREGGEKRSLAEEAETLRQWRKRKINI